ncbi:glycosyltransferase family 39 protein [Priestia aryabhattai]|uniref:ArnT family glycosyltransferase n=1 Tax=Priestia TaxID=2800373 RepID=UPI0020425AB8|nr:MULTISPECIES: glycosyltransferase family 39 protein [Priestia]MCM2976231.1 glycosyltransferase family 39 protein [Priestia aryabhattai]
MLNSFLSKSLILLCVMILTWSLWGSYSAMTNSLDLKGLALSNSFIIEGICITFLVIFLIAIASRYMNKTVFFISLIVLTLGVRLAWMLSVQTPVKSDFLVMLDAARNIAKGNYEFNQSVYFTTWVYQLGFSFYESIVIRCFGDSIFTLKLLNIFYSTGTVIFIYLIGAKVFNELAGRMAAFLYAFYIPNILYSSVLTNQHLATFLFYAAFYLIIKRFAHNKFSWLYIGLLLSLGNLMRPLGPIIIVAVFIYFILQILQPYIKAKDAAELKTRRKKIGKNLVGVLATFFIANALINYSFVASGISKYPLSNRDPLWKFVIGFNYETSGSYSSEDASRFMGMPIGEKRAEAEKEVIKERVADKEQLLDLFHIKFLNMWGGTDASTFWSISLTPQEDVPFNKEKLISAAQIYERIIYVSTTIISIIGLICLFLKKQDKYPYTLFLLLIIGYVLIHLLIEIQTRYRFFIFPSFMLLEGFGISVILSYLLVRFTKNKPQAKCEEIN